MYALPGGVSTQCNILTGSNTIWNCIVTDRKSSILCVKLYWSLINCLRYRKSIVMNGYEVFDVSELYRCYFDLFSIFFRCFFSMFSLSMFCLFRVFAFLCFVVLCFVIDPL